jgi:hypothetical protein
MKNQPPLRGRCVKGSVRLRNPMPLTRRTSTVSINCFIDRASRSSFQTISVSRLPAKSRASMQGGSIRNRARHLLGENLSAPCFGQRVALQGKILVYGQNAGIADQHRFRRRVTGNG